MNEVACVVRRDNLLGEGPVWDAARGRLWWVDIKGRLLQWFDPATGEDGVQATELLVSSVAPREDGTLIAATAEGLAVIDPDTWNIETRTGFEDERPWNRPNDGNVDVAGRYWFGTMDDVQERKTGAVYRVGPDWNPVRAIDGMWITNTLVTSPDGRTLYVCDTGENTIFAYDLDPETGDLGERRVFATTEEGVGPDGSAVDAEGFLWNAQWGGWRVVRYAPDGTIDRTVEVPVQQPSSCAFGGPDLSTLYITSARESLSRDDLAKQPLAGSLLAFEPGVKGLALPPFGG